MVWRGNKKKAKCHLTIITIKICFHPLSILVLFLEIIFNINNIQKKSRNNYFELKLKAFFKALFEPFRATSEQSFRPVFLFTLVLFNDCSLLCSILDGNFVISISSLIK